MGTETRGKPGTISGSRADEFFSVPRGSHLPGASHLGTRESTNLNRPSHGTAEFPGYRELIGNGGNGCPGRTIVTFLSTTGASGLSLLSRFTLAMALTMNMLASSHWPKMVW